MKASILLILLLTACVHSDEAYIQIEVEMGKEFQAFKKVISIIYDSPFKLSPFEASDKIKEKQAKQMLGFIYDPKIQSGEYFFIDLITEKQKGVIGLRFSEIGKNELSTLSKELFHKLIVKLQKEYGKENVSFGTDKSGLKQLQDFIF